MSGPWLFVVRFSQVLHFQSTEYTTPNLHNPSEQRSSSEKKRFYIFFYSYHVVYLFNIFIIKNVKIPEEEQFRKIVTIIPLYSVN